MSDGMRNVNVSMVMHEATSRFVNCKIVIITTELVKTKDEMAIDFEKKMKITDGCTTVLPHYQHHYLLNLYYLQISNKFYYVTFFPTG